MKNIKTLIFLSLFFSMVSCSDYLDVIDLDELTSESVFITEKDMEFALNQLYTFLPTGEVENQGLILPYFWTDDAVHRSINNSGGSQASDFNWQATSSVLSNYYRYAAIADINFFLEAIPGAEFSSEAKRSRFAAEARFIRAMIYERMLFAYGDVPLITKVIAADELPARTPRLEVFNFVISELAEITNQLPSTYDSANNGRITKGAVLALKARTYLNALGWYSNKAELYKDAETACKEIVNSNIYSLAPGISGFAAQFTSASDLVSTETVLATSYIPATFTNPLPSQLAPKGAWRGSEATFANNQSRPGFSSDFIEEVQTINGKFPKNDPTYNPANPWINRDPRLKVTVMLPGDVMPSKASFTTTYTYQPHPSIAPSTDNLNATSCPTGYSFKKYLDFSLGSLGLSDIDIKDIRYSEVLLMYAEALAGQGKNAEALPFLDQVRERVGMPKYATIGLPTVTRGTTGNQMIDAILLERRYEFAGEGPQRWFDIWRYKLGSQVIKQVYGIPKSTILPGDLVGAKYTAANSTFFNRVWNDKYYLLPIPQSARDANSSLSQNPDY